MSSTPTLGTENKTRNKGILYYSIACGRWGNKLETSNKYNSRHVHWTACLTAFKLNKLQYTCHKQYDYDVILQNTVMTTLKYLGADCKKIWYVTSSNPFFSV